MTTRTFARRDSATAVLRKLGLRPRDYDLFIKSLDGKFELSLEAAEAHARALQAQTGAEPDDEAPPKRDGGEREPQALGTPPFDGTLVVDPTPMPAPAKPAKAPRPRAEPKVAKPAASPFAGLGHRAPREPQAKLPPEARQARAARRAALPKAPSRPAKVTCSSRARELIRAGKTNQEVWDLISVEFKLDDKKRLYPAWYRRELRRKGELV